MTVADPERLGQRLVEVFGQVIRLTREQPGYARARRSYIARPASLQELGEVENLALVLDREGQGDLCDLIDDAHLGFSVGDLRTRSSISSPTRTRS